MNKFTQGDIDIMIEALVTFMRQVEEAQEHTYGTLFDNELVEERKRHVLKVLASKPEYAYFYLTQDEREEYGGQQ